MAGKMLSCKNVSFRYRKSDEIPVLDSINLSIAPGEFAMLLGPNACGKSTLLKIFSGLLTPDTGCAELGGEDLRTVGDCKRAVRIASVAQLNNAETALTAEELVMLGRNATLPKWVAPGKADTAALERAMNTMGIAHLRSRRVAELSGGERQRVMIASALARESEILLLDEPASALDPAHSLMLMRVLKKLSSHRAVLMAMHDLPLAAMFADRIILMKEGRIFADGTPEEVLTTENIHAVYGCQSEITRSENGFLRITLY